MWKVEFIGVPLGNITELMLATVSLRNSFDSAPESIPFSPIKLTLSDPLTEEGFRLASLLQMPSTLCNGAPLLAIMKN